MKMRKSLKYIALPMAILMIFSTAAFAGPHYHHHRHCSGNGWGIAAAGLIGGLLIGAIANSSRNSTPRQDPGEYRQDPGEYPQTAPTYCPPAYTAPSAVQTGAKREVELAEKVPGGVIINGQFYAPAQQTTAPTQPYYGNPSGYAEPNGTIKQDPGRTN